MLVGISPANGGGIGHSATLWGATVFIPYVIVQMCRHQEAHEGHGLYSSGGNDPGRRIGFCC
jgi:hypothetical protein